MRTVRHPKLYIVYPFGNTPDTRSELHRRLGSNMDQRQRFWHQAASTHNPNALNESKHRKTIGPAVRSIAPAIGPPVCPHGLEQRQRERLV